MKAARQNAHRHGTDDHGRPPARRRPPWWLPIALAAVLGVVALAGRDAIAWVGRPFAGFFFLDNRIVVSIGRPVWRDPAMRRVEWALVTAVDGTTVRHADALHAAVRWADTGGVVTYTLRRGVEVFRVAIPVGRFTWADFATVFAPMLVVGVWTVLVGAALVVLRPDVAEIGAAFAVCLSIGLMLLTGPDQYGPYRFAWLFYLALAAIPPSIFHLTATFLWWPGAWTRRLVTLVYLLFAALGVVLVQNRFEPAIFLPLLYIVYFALANAIVLYIGTLISAFASGQRLRAHVALALAGVAVPAIVPIVVLVTYPLWTAPVSVPWLIFPIGAWPVLHGIALVKLAAPHAVTEAAR